LAVFALGVILPLALTVCWLWRAGVFATFWFWTFSYASQYATNMALADGIRLLGTMIPKIVGANLGIWLLAGLGLLACVIDHKAREKAPFLLGFAAFSFLAICPTLLFREHYFIVLLPALSLLAAIAVARAVDQLSAIAPRLRYLPIVIFLFALGAGFYQDRWFFLEKDPTAVSRRMFGGNPFPEAIPIADYLRQASAAQAKVAILGSEPEMYFYARRHSATGYIYTYALMEQQRYALAMQKQMIAEIEAARPELLVLVQVQTSWLRKPGSQTVILDWANHYIRDQFELTGIADIHSDHTDYRWGEAAAGYQPRSNCIVFVFKRRLQSSAEGRLRNPVSRRR
jgi:hypothetical protein